MKGHAPLPQMWQVSCCSWNPLSTEDSHHAVEVRLSFVTLSGIIQTEMKNAPSCEMPRMLHQWELDAETSLWMVLSGRLHLAWEKGCLEQKQC